MSNYAYENLTQSGLAKINSKDDKNVSLSIDSFGGMTGFAVWTGAGGKPWKQNIPRKTINSFIILLKKMQADIRPCREAIMLNMFDTETKRFKQVGQIGIGIDENLTFQFDISHQDLNGRHIFPIKSDGRFDFSNTSMSEKDTLAGHIGWIIDLLRLESVVAERMSSFKRATGGQGGNRGNYSGGQQSGGNRNYSNNNNSGGGGYQGSPPSNGGSFGNDNSNTVTEADLHI